MNNIQIIVDDTENNNQSNAFNNEVINDCFNEVENETENIKIDIKVLQLIIDNQSKMLEIMNKIVNSIACIHVKFDKFFVAEKPATSPATTMNILKPLTSEFRPKIIACEEDCTELENQLRNEEHKNVWVCNCR